MFLFFFFPFLFFLSCRMMGNAYDSRNTLHASSLFLFVIDWLNLGWRGLLAQGASGSVVAEALNPFSLCHFFFLFCFAFFLTLFTIFLLL
ncbi:hypothetical protein HOY80DRAFT_965722 [Tuber brumale]|nr:hypothetical protein HOY80DRAFT_965722 [Tuber brumale]